MIIKLAKYQIRRVRRKLCRIGDQLHRAMPWVRRRLKLRLEEHLSAVDILASDFPSLRDGCLSYVESLAEPDGVRFRYAASVKKPVLYGSMYALLVYSLFGRIESLSQSRRACWKAYFDAHQDPDTGLFYDPALDTPHYRNGDSWGDRHLAAHMVLAYAALGERPPHKFGFLAKYNTPEKIRTWLEHLRVSMDFVYASNQIMNIGTLLQYQRDFFGDADLQPAVDELFRYMSAGLDPHTGLWWGGELRTKRALSNAVQGAYHIHTLYLYDKVDLPHKDKMIENVLKTQNELGGFGVQLNSTGCEDIDSIFPLCAYGVGVRGEKQVRETLLMAHRWVLSHRNADGGLAWVRDRPYEYGHPLLASCRDESNLFGTWFRCLSLAYLVKFCDMPNEFHINRCPGYEIRLT